MPNDERRTPKELFDRLDETFAFTVDAAASNENHLCGNYWTKESDGLLQCWDGHVVFCNPPYSRGQLGKWIEKAYRSRALTIMLLPGDCSTFASQYALEKASAVLFVNKRLAFDDEPSGAKFPSWIVLFHGNRRDVAKLRNLNMGVVL